MPHRLAANLPPLGRVEPLPAVTRARFAPGRRRSARHVARRRIGNQLCDSGHRSGGELLAKPLLEGQRHHPPASRRSVPATMAGTDHSIFSNEVDCVSYGYGLVLQGNTPPGRLKETTKWYPRGYRLERDLLLNRREPLVSKQACRGHIQGGLRENHQEHIPSDTCACVTNDPISRAEEPIQ